MPIDLNRILHAGRINLKYGMLKVNKLIHILCWLDWKTSGCPLQLVKRHRNTLHNQKVSRIWIITLITKNIGIIIQEFDVDNYCHLIRNITTAHGRCQLIITRETASLHSCYFIRLPFSNLSYCQTAKMMQPIFVQLSKFLITDSFKAVLELKCSFLFHN